MASGCVPGLQLCRSPSSPRSSELWATEEMNSNRTKWTLNNYSLHTCHIIQYHVWSSSNFSLYGEFSLAVFVIVPLVIALLHLYHFTVSSILSPFYLIPSPSLICYKVHSNDYCVMYILIQAGRSRGSQGGQCLPPTFC